MSITTITIYEFFCQVRKILNTILMRATIVLFLSIIAFGLSAQTTKKKMLVTEYINQYKEVAQDIMDTHKIPVSIKLGQAILESSYGTSELAVNANNHFGMKCGKNCERFYLKVDDDVDKNGKKIPSKFQVFETPTESYYAHNDFLSKERYLFLYDLNILDYKAWAKGLYKAGYATNPKYAEHLISVIEKYELHELDKQVIRGKTAIAYSSNTLNQMAEQSAPSYPSTLQSYKPTSNKTSTTVQTFPTEASAPQRKDTSMASKERGSINEKIYEEVARFSSVDVSDYEPSSYSILNKMDTENESKVINQINNISYNKPIGGGNKAR